MKFFAAAKRSRLILVCALLAGALSARAAEGQSAKSSRPASADGSRTSVAGLFPLANSGRVVYNFNEGWRFRRGDAANAESASFDDSRWEVVCAPHSVQLEPSEASGGRNYQGVCWYRKRFVVPQNLSGRQIILHFEAIMGKQWVYVNGRLAASHRGGYLPVIVDLGKAGAQAGKPCVIAVKADNRDDGGYPPGKPQNQLDFAYHGGMYRDVWLIGRAPLHISDALERGKVAGGGVFLHYDNITRESADVYVDVEVESTSSGGGSASADVVAKIKDAKGATVETLRQRVQVEGGRCATAKLHAKLKNPHLWSPEDPYLYDVEIQLTRGGANIDGGVVRMGIRRAEFRGRDGFWLNGEPYHQLIGGNRHQDFAYVGNALPNSQQWRDALRMKEAGMIIVRAAHYPQDPAFMDACDELGLFVIVTTPGWQYWSNAPDWAGLVHENTRLIVRRDRNHPSVLMWEPILNETGYPRDFAVKALEVTREEFPWPGRPVAAADMGSQGVRENYDVLYEWWGDGRVAERTDKCIFTREWGEYVDDWYAHNAINRAARGWGEHAMLAAALSLVDTYGVMFRGQRQFIGGCQWHPFDHQRGYHPDAFLGGIYDAFRQKKYAYEAFHAQVTSPYVYIAHEMTPYSPEDVTVFANCDSVRLTALNGWKSETLPVVRSDKGVPFAPVVFKGFWDQKQARRLAYNDHRWQNVKLVAEGLVDGKVVYRTEKMPSRRSTRLRLYADEMGKPLVADGSDFIVVVAEVTDDSGNVRRQAREHITFTVEGEGAIIGGPEIAANPRQVEWGSAPVLVRSTHKAGEIRITARPTFDGTHAPTAATLTIRSVPSDIPSCYDEEAPKQPRADGAGAAPENATRRMSEAERRKSLEEVERQQEAFGKQ